MRKLGISGFGIFIGACSIGIHHRFEDFRMIAGYRDIVDFDDFLLEIILDTRDYGVKSLLLTFTPDNFSCCAAALQKL